MIKVNSLNLIGDSSSNSSILKNNTIEKLKTLLDNNGIISTGINGGSGGNNLLNNSNVKTIISNNATIIKTGGVNTNSLLNGKIVNIPTNHVLYPGLIGTSSNCALLHSSTVSVIDGSKLSGEGAEFFNKAKVWHTHAMAPKGLDGKLLNNNIYELVYNENTYFYKLKGSKAPENVVITPKVSLTSGPLITPKKPITITEKSTSTFENTSQINNEVITNNTINQLINKDIYQNVIIVLNMNSNLCGNKSICYLKFDFYISNLNIIYKTLYVKYYNSSGLINKELIKFTLANSTEKTMLQNGFIKITAYQLSDLSDSTPYVIGKFKYSDCESKTKNMTLYRFLDINQYYKFSFDDIVIYPTNISGKLYKVSGTVNNTLSINNIGQIFNNNIMEKKIYTYTLDYNNINVSSNILNPKAIILNIDNNEIWSKYHDFCCNVSFYLKNGNTYVMTYLLFNKLGSQLILNETIKIDQSKFSVKNIIKFTITYLGAKKIDEHIKFNNIKLSKQGNIINN